MLLQLWLIGGSRKVHPQKHSTNVAALPTSGARGKASAAAPWRRRFRHYFIRSLPFLASVWFAHSKLMKSRAVSTSKITLKTLCLAQTVGEQNRGNTHFHTIGCRTIEQSFDESTCGFATNREYLKRVCLSFWLMTLTILLIRFFISFFSFM